jgi:hypothetical protein
MTIYVRDQNRVTFLYESGTYATPSGTSGTWIGLVTNHTPTENENLIEIRYAGTSTRNYSQLVAGPQDFEGAITYYPQNFRMVAFALGSCIDVSGTTSKHTVVELNSDGRYAYTSGASQLTNVPSFTIKDSKKALADGQHLIRTINGCVVDTFTLNANQNDVVTCELTYKGQAFTLGSKTTDILSIREEDTTRPYVWSDTTLSLGGTSVVEANTISYSIENGVQNRHYVNGSRVTQAMIPTTRNHTINLTMDANNIWGKTLTDYHKNGSVFNMQLTLSQGAAENGNFYFSGCKIQELEYPSEVEGIDEFSFTIRPQTVSFIGSDTTAFYNPY